MQHHPHHPQHKDETIEFHQIISMISRYLFLFSFLGALGAGGAYELYQIAPKKYKSVSTLNIQNSYFQIPLVNDFVSGSSEAGEIQAQKQALLGLAINDEFVRELGEKYRVFTAAPNTAERMAELELFQKSIESFSISANTFQISVPSGTPDKSFQMTQDTLAHVIDTLIGERTKKLVQYRDSLKTKLDSISPAPGQKPVYKTVTTQAPADPLVREIRILDAKIRLLETQLSPEHPSVMELKEELNSKRVQLAATPAASPIETHRVLVTQAVPGKENELYQDLSKKLNYLDIVLGLESDRTKVSYLKVIQVPTRPAKAAAPKLRDFLAAGAGAGLVLSLLIAILNEARRSQRLSMTAPAPSYGPPVGLTRMPRQHEGNWIDAYEANASTSTPPPWPPGQRSKS